MRRKFIIKVPCTVIDRYAVFAESEAEAYEKMASGNMTEVTTTNELGDYQYLGKCHDEPETDWTEALIIGEDTNA